MSSDKIKVAVRVRPFNRRERELNTQCVVVMNDEQTILQYPTSSHDKIDRKQPKTFAFDHCFESVDPSSPNYASQAKVFDCLGTDILDNAFEGYNACIFAYGQTGSGKSYTMMGALDAAPGGAGSLGAGADGAGAGVIPRLCDALFARIALAQRPPHLTYKVEVSYMEIYNERVHDLLDPDTRRRSLRVREHAVLGPYVDGLSQLAVTAYQDIDNLMAEGNKSRTVAATNMNSESSRSHAVFSVVLTQTLTDAASGVSGEKVSRLSLVDLAGSERAVKTGAVGDRLKEGSNINKSLTTLGLVISKLADQSSGKPNKDKFVPYRDSVLTWLLKDNLGGNSKTVMVATISPAADNYEETLSTLRYADRAKRIVNHAVVNEDPNARIIRELRQEVEALKEMLKYATGSPVDSNRVDIHEKLAQSEHLMKEMSQTWEEKLVKTGRIQNERHQALEKMGISVQASGIKVEKNKYYLVNLNADPSLNELLVYYLKDRTLVGNREYTSAQPDIQLSGLGIQPEHCLLLIESGGLYMEPLPGARSFVNGSEATGKICLEHGDRILWGNHHFFRVNCPKAMSATSEPQTPAQPIDYNFARDEIMLNKLSNDPIQTAISRLEKQHEEDKQVALEKQRQEYERQFQQLRNILSPSTPYPPYNYDPLRIGKLTPCTPTTALRVERWAAERDDTFRRSLAQLKADIMRANAGVQEANTLARETKRRTRFSVTLQIPPQNLSPNRKRGAFVSEPAILVRRPSRPGQVWSMEKLENKLVDMRELYNEFCQRREMLRASGDSADMEDDVLPEEDNIEEAKEELQEGKAVDPFYESQENHNLIGVANIFLEALFHDVVLDYHTPIISQQGEVAGRLQVEISRIAGQFPQDRICEAASDSSGDTRDDDDPPDPNTQQVTCRVVIKQASGLPPSLSHFVFCQYSFWGGQEPIVVPPQVNADVPVPAPLSIHRASLPGSPRHLAQQPHMQFQFDHQKDFVVPISEEFLEHCSEGALSIEVWGHRSAGWGRTGSSTGSVVGNGGRGWGGDTGEEVQRQLAKARSLADRWAELTRKIQLWVEIHELNDQGEYAPVEVLTKTDMLTGGVYQLRQGQQRRLQVRVKPAPCSGTLPIVCQHIDSIEVGSVSVRSRLQKPLDSYQEEDLAVLRERWSDALARRRQHLHAQLQRLVNMSPSTKTERDLEREQSLVEQWVSLTEERNAVLVPSPGSPIPGAPAAWSPPLGMEHHIPVLFLDLNADDMSTHLSGEEVAISGLNSILPKEHGNKFYDLQILQHLDHDVSAIASWDSSIHDSQYLNRITEANERVYLILKTTVRLSHPVPMDLVLRKRLGLNIYKKQSLTERIRKRIARSDVLTQTGVTYEVVSNIPKASEELEERESLAQIVATGEEASFADGETYIEKYTRGVSAVESILSLDRLRQSVAVRELQQASHHPIHSNNQAMRKTASVPNFSQIMRLDASLESLIGVGRSESVTDLNNAGTSSSSGSSGTSLSGRLPLRPGRHSYAGETDITSPPKPFGLARPTFLNLNINLNSLRLQQPKSSPASGKLGGLRMTTLHEEPGVPSGAKRNSIAEEDDDSHSDSEAVPPVSVSQPLNRIRNITRGLLSSSKTLDSLHELASDQGPAKNSPSITSSGYGSQAVSSTNLTIDDALSIRSMSVDETPDLELKNDSSHGYRLRQSMIGIRSEIADLKNDLTDIRSDLSESRNGLNDSISTKSKSSAITPGSKRINPFLRDCENELADARTTIDNDQKSTGNHVTQQEPQYFDPLGSLPVQNNVITSSSQYHRLSEASHQQKLVEVNGDASHDIEVESVTSENSSPDSNGDTRSNDVSSTGGDYDSPYEGNSIVRTQLPPGKVVRRRKPSQNNSLKSSSTNRASFPQSRPRSGDIKSVLGQQPLEQQMAGLDMEYSSSSERILDDDCMERSVGGGVRELPSWCVLGESVQVRLTSCTGVIAYIGPTEFAHGVWVGVDLDTPTGKNDGVVNGKQYFSCRTRHGIFVRPDKLVIDRRGRALRQYQNTSAPSSTQSATLRRAGSRGEGLSNLHRSRSRGESINAVGNRNNSRPKY